MEALESITFPASMTKFWYSAVLRCRSLKYVVFLADDPATAVYPATLGKKVDWYVPDNMVDHVKALIADKKVDAKAAKPLSKLIGGKPAPTKNAPAKKTPAKKVQA